MSEEVKKNRIFVAAAGSGKTWKLVNEALSRPDSKILITTYTDANAGEIEKRFFEEHGCVPPNVTIMGWFSFLLEHGVRPYQGSLTDKRIAELHFNQGVSALYKAETALEHYLDSSGKIYRDKVSKFSCKCNDLSNGRVITRIAGIYDEVFVDEVQDIAGYDLEFVELLMNSSVQVLLVGDPRQGTYSTNDSPKYAKFKKAGIVDYFRLLARERADVLLDETSLAINRRCPQALCDLSDALFPQFSRSNSSNTVTTDHVGIFLIHETSIEAYLQVMKPMQLRYSRKTLISDKASAMNFGESKGLTFDRALIYPTKDFVKWLQNPDRELSADVRAKSYVALTRARFSAGIVVSGKTNLPGFEVWQP
ncbi:MAG: UvrD-helicase domain-containing protein [Pseudomonadota bacterium]